MLWVDVSVVKNLNVEISYPSASSVLIPVGPNVLDWYFIVKNLNVEICVWAGSAKSVAPTFNSLQSLIDFI